MMRFPRTVRFRLTAWYCLVLALLLALFGALVYGSVRHRLIRHHDGPLREMAAAVVHILNEREDCHTLEPDQVKTLDQLGHVVLIHETKGEHRVFYQSPEMTDNPLAPAVGSLGWDAVPAPKFVTINHQGLPWRVLSVPYTSKAGRQGVVRLMEDLGDTEQTLASLGLSLLLLMPIGVALSAMAGYWLSRKALAPIDEIAHMAREIEATKLNRRLPGPGVDDEIGRLVDTLNHMIARLEESFEAMGRFTADASHELRSPLATMRNTIDVLLQQPRSVEEQRAGLESVGEDVDRLRKIVNDLLLLARADAGRIDLERTEVELDRLVISLAETYEARAEEGGVTLVVDAPVRCEVLGDERWLYQLVGNLLDNALKFTPRGGLVEASLTVTEASVRLDIRDSGPGIPVEDLERVFDRFYQVDPSRTGKLGSGLGLSICAWIAATHGGRIWASARSTGGACLAVELPLAHVGQNA